jgi:hypothetical protein
LIDIQLNPTELLDEADVRTRRLREIRETLNLGPPASSEVESCLSEVKQRIFELIQPEACFREIDGSATTTSLDLGSDLTLKHKKLTNMGDQINGIYAYALSLGYDSSTMMQKLNNDYALYHFHYYIARTCLLLINRRFYDQVCSDYPDSNWHRFPVLVQMDDNQASEPLKRHYWDPMQIARILAKLPDTRTQFQVTDAGCITPIFSIIGVMVST